MSNPWKISAKLDGVDQVVLKLQSVDKNVRKKLMRKAITKATQPVAKAAKRGARSVVNQVAANDELGQAMKSSGLLAKSIGSKVKTYPSGVVVGLVGPRGGFNRQIGVRKRGKNAGQAINADPIYYAHLVEYGTRRSRAKPFMRPAWDQTKDQAQAAIVSVLKDGIAAAVT